MYVLLLYMVCMHVYSPAKEALGEHQCSVSDAVALVLKPSIVLLVHIAPVLGSAWGGSPNRGPSGPVSSGGHCPDSEGPTDTTLIPLRGKDSVTIGT